MRAESIEMIDLWIWQYGAFPVFWLRLVILLSNNLINYKFY